jgi:hypothetical protein
LKQNSGLKKRKCNPRLGELAADLTGCQTFYRQMAQALSAEGLCRPAKISAVQKRAGRASGKTEEIYKNAGRYG